MSKFVQIKKNQLAISIFIIIGFCIENLDMVWGKNLNNLFESEILKHKINKITVLYVFVLKIIF